MSAWEPSTTGHQSWNVETLVLGSKRAGLERWLRRGVKGRVTRRNSWGALEHRTCCHVHKRSDAALACATRWAAALNRTGVS